MKGRNIKKEDKGKKKKEKRPAPQTGFPVAERAGKPNKHGRERGGHKNMK